MSCPQAPPKDPTHCRRCGTCCRKGGPALHLADRELVVSGKLALRDLFTIRHGEPAYDNVRNTICLATSDIIKIKSVEGASASACRFLDPVTLRCGIYADRPMECRELTCWDTRAVIALYDQARLTRQDLIGAVEGLSELVADHQQQCDCARVADLAASLRHGNTGSAAAAELLEMLRYDQSLRAVTVERTGLDAELMAFLFGRPLARLLPVFQLKLVGSRQHPTIVAAYEDSR